MCHILQRIVECSLLFIIWCTRVSCLQFRCIWLLLTTLTFLLFAHISNLNSSTVSVVFKLLHQFYCCSHTFSHGCSVFYLHQWRTMFSYLFLWLKVYQRLKSNEKCQHNVATAFYCNGMSTTELKIQKHLTCVRHEEGAGPLSWSQMMAFT